MASSSSPQLTDDVQYEGKFSIIEPVAETAATESDLTRAERSWKRIACVVGALDKIRKTFWAYGRICSRFSAFPKRIEFHKRPDL